MKDAGTELYETPELGQKVVAYSEQHSTPLPKYITDYHAYLSANREDSFFLSSNFQSQLHTLLAKSIGAKRVLEIGVYLGYSALVWSNAVGPDGAVTGLEYDAGFAKLAIEAFAARNVENIDIIVGPAQETLPGLDPSVPYDIVFIDADKPGYPGYLEQLLAASAPGGSRRLLRPGALIISDNVLRRGIVTDDALESRDIPERQKQQALAIQVFNDFVVKNPRLETFLVPLFDGVSVTRLVD